MKGTIHNAKKCTVDGRDLWIAALCDDKWRFSCRGADVSEHATASAARTWLEREARARGFEAIEIELEP
jgi:hypothetical protein